MLDRRALRFLVEALILVAIAAAATVAELRPLAIAGVMLLGWAVVSLLEWAFLLGEPHYASGLPPRYYEPPILLPAAAHPQPEQAPFVPEPAAPAASVGVQEPVPEVLPSPLELEPDLTQEPASPYEEELTAASTDWTAWFDAELPGGVERPGLFEVLLDDPEGHGEEPAAGTTLPDRSSRNS